MKGYKNKEKRLVDMDEQELSIPALKNVVRPDYTVTRRVVWLLVFVGCVTIICIQARDRINYYTNGPVNLRVEFRAYNAMPVPNLTVCHAKYMRLDLIDKMRQFLKDKNLGQVSTDVSLHHLLLFYSNITEMWEGLGFKLEDIVNKCFVQGTVPCDKVGTWSPVASVRGMCYTYSSKYATLNPSNTMQGVNLVLHDNATTTQQTDLSWRLLIHSGRDNPAAEVTSKGLYLRPNTAVDIQLKRRTFNFTSTTKKQCAESSMSECLFKCFIEKIYSEAGCKLPFMQKMEGPYCSTPASYRLADTISRQLIMNYSVNCPCLLPCRHTVYDVSVDSRYTPTSGLANATYVRLYFDDLIYEYVEEIPAYGIVAMLCDIGGSLGLFLGASVLSLVQLAEFLVRHFRYRYVRKQQAEEEVKQKPPFIISSSKC